jgi:hypothetical protein
METVSVLPTSHIFYDTQQKSQLWKCFESPLKWRIFRTSILVVSFMESVPQIPPPGNEAPCAHRGVRLLSYFIREEQFTEPPGSPVVVCTPLPNSPTHTPDLSHVLQNPKQQLPQWRSSVRLRAGAEEVHVGVGGPPCPTLPCPALPTAIWDSVAQNCPGGALQPANGPSCL